MATVSVARVTKTKSLVHLSLCYPLACRQLLSTTACCALKQLPPRIKINEGDLIENFIKGGGSGGQKINKTNSLVQLIHKPTDIHIRCQATRSRSQNRTIGRRMLAERIEELERGDESRTSIKADKAKKKKASSMKKKRRKYQECGKDERSEIRNETNNAAGIEQAENSADDTSARKSIDDSSNAGTRQDLQDAG